MNITFAVPGKPVGKGRPKFFRRGNFVGTYTPKETASYENLVKVMFLEAASKQGWTKPDRETPIAARILAWFTMPASWSKKKRASIIRQTHKPDTDNIAKIILDSLNGVAYEDDSAVCALYVCKKYSGEDRVIVELETLDQAKAVITGSET